MRWIVYLWKEIFRWRTLYRWTSKDENEKLLNSVGLNVDWVGRIYTEIEITHENPTEQDVLGILSNEIKTKYEKFLKRLNIINYIDYDYFQISPNKWMLVMTPDISGVKKNTFIFAFLTSLLSITILSIWGGIKYFTILNFFGCLILPQIILYGLIFLILFVL